jgi:anti-anti-sigma factor
MRIEREKLKHFLILTLKEEIDLEKDAEDLTRELESAINDGYKYIALRFTHVSYIYSGIIKVIIKYFKKIQTLGGMLTIIETNKALYDVLDVIGVARVLRIFFTIKDFEEHILKA